MSSTIKPLAWVTGANGLIGYNLLKTASTCAPEFDVKGIIRSVVDLTDFSAVRSLLDSQPPQLIIHCAALSKNPECDANPALAWKLNVDVTSMLAELAADITFIFLSSDLVFDGKQASYVETDAPNPLGVYAKTKEAAEKVVLANSRHFVVRTSLNGGYSPTRDRGFNQQMRQAWQAGKAITLFTDEYRCPIAASVTARALWELAHRGQPGIYHLAGRQLMSRWEVGQCVAARCPELHPKIIAESIRNYQGPPRPASLCLDCAKIQKILSFPLPSLPEWMEQNPSADF